MVAIASGSTDAHADWSNVEGVCVSSNCNAPTGNGSSGNGWTPEFSEPTPDPATEINNRGVQFHNKGDWAGAIALYRQAHSMTPGSVIIRLNLMFSLTQEAVRLAHSSHDSSTLAQVESMINEVESLDDASLAGRAERDQLLQWIASGRRDLANIRAEERQKIENQRALQSASHDISGIARELSTSIAADSKRRGGTPTGSLGFGDPSAAPDLNPAAGTKQARAITGDGRPSAPAGTGVGGSTDARRQLEAIQQHPEASAKGGTAQGIDTSGTKGVTVIDTFHSTYSPEQIAAYSARSAAVREAQAAYVRDHEVAVQARARKSQLETQAATTPDKKARARIQIEISNYSQFLANAESAELIAKNKRDEAIKVVMKEGAPDIEGAPPPASPKGGSAQPAPRAPAGGQ